MIYLNDLGSQSRLNTATTREQEFHAGSPAQPRPTGWPRPRGEGRSSRCVSLCAT